MWKLGEILQTIEQSKIFRDFFDSERFKASQKRTKQARVKTSGSFYTASVESGLLAADLQRGPLSSLGAQRAGGRRRCSSRRACAWAS